MNTVQNKPLLKRPYLEGQSEKDIACWLQAEKEYERYAHYSNNELKVFKTDRGWHAYGMTGVFDTRKEAFAMNVVIRRIRGVKFSPSCGDTNQYLSYSWF